MGKIINIRRERVSNGNFRTYWVLRTDSPGKDFPMNKFLLSAALCAVLAAPAMAQPDHNRGHERHETHSGNRGEHDTRRPTSTPTARPAPAAPSRPAATRANDNRPSSNRPSSNRPSSNRRDNDRRHDADRRGNNNRPGFNQPDHRARPGVRPHRRPDYSKWRRAVTSPRRFHIGRYHAPRGYHYRRWNYGQFLPSAYWARSFWLSNFVAYGLFAPPPDAVWVRYGPDALLIDRYTGEIISVQYNVFY
jgi:Ni/Co efflux regulator RcnB